MTGQAFFVLTAVLMLAIALFRVLVVLTNVWAAYLILGGLFNRMAPVLWVIAVLSNLTVIHRMIYTFQEAKRLENVPVSKAQKM